MPDISANVTIDRPAATVAAFLEDLTRQGDWQSSLISVHADSLPIRVGTRVSEHRRIPGGTHSVTYEITEFTPGRGFAFRGKGGPVEVSARVRIDPVDEGSCRVTAEFDFRAGLKGKVLLPLVRREAGRQLPEDQARLKALLESG